MKPTDADPQRQVQQARDLTLGGLLGALAIALPLAFHGLGPGVGPVLLPMYLPILALGLLVRWPTALAVAVTAPLLSSALTGMPPLAPPIAFLMAIELAALAVGASLARTAGLGVWPAALAAQVASRLGGALALLTIGRALGYQRGFLDYSLLSLAVAWPGIALQLAVVPPVVRRLEQGSLLGRPVRSKS